MKNIKNKFRILAPFWISILIASCGGVIDDVSEDTARINIEELITPEAAIDLEGFNTAVQAVYSDFRLNTQLNDHVAPAWSGDDMAVVNVKAAFVEFDSRSVTETNARTLATWRQLNNVLALIATTINSIEDNVAENIDDASEEQLVFSNLYLGELRFLRSLIFHQYVRVFGRGFLLVNAGQPVNTLATAEETYRQIEEDLLFAEENLFNIHPDANGPGADRPNVGSAKALLARVYMDWAGFPVEDVSKYALAAEKSLEVIQGSGTFGFDLVSDFESLWSLSNQNNAEGVFIVEFNGEQQADRQDNRKYGPVGFSGDDGGWDETFSEIKFWEDFPEGPRKDGTFRADLEDAWPNYVNISQPVYTKIAGPEGELNTSAFNTSRTDYYIRYSDVLLMFAEASSRAGQESPLSWEALNQVRRRAYPSGTPDLGPGDGDLAEIAFDERKWEFAGEWIRWYDLVRTKKVQEALSDRAPRTTRNASGDLLEEENPITGSLETDNYFAPIPADIVSENPGFEN